MAKRAAEAQRSQGERPTAASVAAAIAPRAASGTVPAAQVDGGSGGDEDGEEEV
jgi:hypothetical protein